MPFLKIGESLINMTEIIYIEVRGLGNDKWKIFCAFKDKREKDLLFFDTLFEATEYLKYLEDRLAGLSDGFD